MSKMTSGMTQVVWMGFLDRRIALQEIHGNHEGMGDENLPNHSKL